MAKTQSKRSKTASKRKAVRPPKPYPEFPLTPHPQGYWCKTIRGKLHYFGRWGKVVNGQMERLPDDGWKEALDLYKAQADDLYAGRVPRQKVEGLTVKDLCNRFLTAKQNLKNNDELNPRTFAAYNKMTDIIIERFGNDRLLTDLKPEDFGTLRAKLAKTRGPHALSHAITIIRMVFKFAYDEELIEREVRYGQQFDRPSKKTFRKHRANNGKKLFEADQIRLILKHAKGPMRAMVLLGINCGFGGSDLSALPQTAINGSWIDYPRGKTGIERRCPLWPETVEAVRQAIEARPTPKDPANDTLVFITKYGQVWVKKETGSSDDAVTKEFAKLLKELGIYRKGLGFYALRHTFQTIGEEAGETACKHIMGHNDNSMSAVYREQISDKRLLAVTGFVRDWLFTLGVDLYEL